MKTQFTPIAMKCNKKQFDSVKEKLNGIINFNSVNNFDKYNYLSNISGLNIDGTICKSLNSINKEMFNYVWDNLSNTYETWNEEIFLKACGIEVTPTLEEVKKHFENAKEILEARYKTIADISKERTEDINFELDCYWVRMKDSHESGSVRLWGKDYGYAEIISYKDTYTVNKEFIKEAYDNPELLKEKFPSVFDSELIVGKWYKSNYIRENGKKSKFLGYITGQDTFYGFNYEGEYKYNAHFNNKSNTLELATPQEVGEALINEAKRRGFKEGVKYISPNGNFKRTVVFPLTICHEGKDLVCDNSEIIFKDGIWAEIISEPIELTIGQIADKFNVDVNLLKIKK